ncbi:MAG: HlyD family secretion protein [Firmicutes bacterium]|nr:HlyD family secretion protein [Bacillota bacterium]
MSNQLPAPEKTNRAERRPRLWLTGIAVLVLAVGIVLGFRWWIEIRSHVGTDDALIEAAVVQVAPKVGGRISQVLVDTGDRVKQGQVLARLETEDLEASVRRAEAAAAARSKDVLQAEAALRYEERQVALRNVGAEAAVEGSDLRVEQALTGAALEEQRVANRLRQARAALAAAEADREKAQVDLVRMESLLSEGAVAAQQDDAAKNAAANAQARVEASQAEVALAKAERAQTDIKRQEIAAARTSARQARATLQETEAAHLQVALRQAQLEATQAQAKEASEAVRLARIAFQNAEIRSPATGVITQKLAEPGEMMAVGQPLFTLTQDTGENDVWVVANLEETQVRGVRVGQPVEIAVDAYPSTRFHGRVIEIRAGTQAQFSLIPAQQSSGSFTKVTQRIPVKIAIESDNGRRLVPGMSVVVRIDVSHSRSSSVHTARKTVGK